MQVAVRRPALSHGLIIDKYTRLSSELRKRGWQHSISLLLQIRLRRLRLRHPVLQERLYETVSLDSGRRQR